VRTARFMIGAAALAALACLGRRAEAKVSDVRLFVKPVLPAKVRVGGALDARLALTAKHMRSLPADYLLAPFKRRTGDPRNGQLLAHWLAFASDYAAYRHDEALAKQVEARAAALAELQRKDGFIGLDPSSVDDGWVGAQLVTALLRVAENGQRSKSRVDAEQLTHSLAKRFPPESPTDEQVVVGRCVLESICRTYDCTRHYDLIDAARKVLKRDKTHLLDFLRVNHRLGYPPAERHYLAGRSHEVLTYLNGLAAYHQISAGAQLGPALADAWSDIDRKYRYVTGGLPGVLKWRVGTTPDDSDDNAATAAWLRFNLQMWYSTGESRYLDSAERILFNHLPFAQDVRGEFTTNNNLFGRAGSRDAITTGECARVLMEALQAVYSTRRDEVYVNLYTPSSVDLRLAYGGAVTLTQTTSYPRDGQVTVEVTPTPRTEFTLFLRIPQWCSEHKITLNGAPVTAPLKKGRVGIKRLWTAGDRVALTLTMGFHVARRAGGAADTQQVAVQYGPLVMCVDSQFNEGLRRPFRFVSPRGREAELFESVQPASVGRSAGPFAVPVAATGKAFSAGRAAVVHITPFANCVRQEGGWWRVWLTVYEPNRSSPPP